LDLFLPRKKGYLLGLLGGPKSYGRGTRWLGFPWRRNWKEGGSSKKEGLG